MHGLSQVWNAGSHPFLGILGVMMTPESIMHPGSYSTPGLTHRINSLLSFCASSFQSVPRSKSHVL